MAEWKCCLCLSYFYACILVVLGCVFINRGWIFLVFFTGKCICGLVISVFLDKHLPSVRCIGRFLIHSVTLVTGMTSVTEMLKKPQNKTKSPTTQV